MHWLLNSRSSYQWILWLWQHGFLVDLKIKKRSWADTLISKIKIEHKLNLVILKETIHLLFFSRKFELMNLNTNDALEGDICSHGPFNLNYDTWRCTYKEYTKNLVSNRCVHTGRYCVDPNFLFSARFKSQHLHNGNSHIELRMQRTKKVRCMACKSACKKNWPECHSQVQLLQSSYLHRICILSFNIKSSKHNIWGIHWEHNAE